MIIDLVYLWVDGNDPKWIDKKNVFTENFENNLESTCKGRFANNDELKYSLRSVEKYATWIRKIFIVTDNQTPEWLDTTNPKIKIIDHQDIIPEDCLPCFNSTVIEYFLYKIPDLSDFFLFANDDMFFGADVSPEFFFNKDGFPIIRLKRKIFAKFRYKLKQLTGKKIRQYRKKLLNSSLLVENMFNKYYSGIPHHNIDAYKKDDYSVAIERVFKQQVEKSMNHHFRNEDDIHRSVISYYVLAIGHGYLKYVGKKEALQIDAYKQDVIKRFSKYKSKLFCINDNEKVNDEDRTRIKQFLENIFPEKSEFEI